MTAGRGVVCLKCKNVRIKMIKGEDKMRDNRKLQWGSIICIVLLHLIHTFILLPADVWTYTPYEHFFFIAWYRLVRDVGIGYLAVVLWRWMVHKEKRSKGFIIAAAVCLLVIILRDKETLLFWWIWWIWPFLVLGFARYIRDLKLTLGVNQWKLQEWEPGEFWGSLIYCGLVLLTMGMFWHSQSYYWLERDILGSLYFSAVVCVGWYCSDENGKSRKNPICLIFTGVFFWKFLGASYRIKEIIGSLKNPITAVTGMHSKINWLGNRMYMLKQIWLGQPGMSAAQREDTVGGISLAVAKNQYGAVGVAVILFLQGILIYMLYRLYRKRIQTQEHIVWYRMTFLSIVIWTVIAFAGQILLISSTYVDFMFLGATQMSAMVMILLLGLSGNKKAEMSNTYIINLKNGKIQLPQEVYGARKMFGFFDNAGWSLISVERECQYPVKYVEIRANIYDNNSEKGSSDLTIIASGRFVVTSDGIWDVPEVISMNFQATELILESTLEGIYLGTVEMYENAKKNNEIFLNEEEI